MQKIKCALVSLICIALASAILFLVLRPKTYAVEPKVIEPQTPQEIKAYIIQQAKAEHVNLTIATWIVSHESRWGLQTLGDVDNGVSVGVWQINLARNENVSRQCAESVICSTRLSFAWLKKGEASKWSSWRFRCLWFRDENPPDCPAG